MEIAQLLAALEDAGERLATAAERAGLDAKTPSCPEWVVRDLVFHQGGVHRWAATTVRERRTSPPEDVGGDPLRDAAQRPPNGELLAWFRQGHRALLSTLQSAPPDVECWAFLPAPSPLAFWVRRQTHETTIHRVDAELAVGEPSPIDPQVAVDGIDELLTGFASRRRGRLRTEVPKTLAVEATDTGDRWHVTVSQDPVVVTRSDEETGTTLRGPAADVYLALWNRRSLGSLDAFGDHEVLSKWPQAIQVRWS